MGKLRWEQLARDNDNSDIVTWRAKVPGGWLISVWAAKAEADGGGKTPMPGGSNWGGGLTFMAAAEWDVELARKS
jgi:hypothetical protein